MTAVMKSELTGSGDTVVLVPGGLTGWLSWGPHTKQLAANYQVVRVQLLSVEYGLKNEPLPKGYSVNYEVNALTHTLDQNKVKDAHFAGWSYGAAILLSFALNNPDKVRTLTLIEPPAFWVLRSKGPLSKEVLEDQKIMQSLGLGEVSESQLEWFTHYAAFVPPTIDPKRLPQWSVWVKHRQSLRIGDSPYRHEEGIEKVRTFEKPVLLFKGDGSAKYYHQIIDVLASEFPSAQVKLLPGGHALHIVSMNEFMNIFTSFIK